MNEVVTFFFFFFATELSFCKKSYLLMQEVVQFNINWDKRLTSHSVTMHLFLVVISEGTLLTQHLVLLPMRPFNISCHYNKEMIYFYRRLHSVSKRSERQLWQVISLLLWKISRICQNVFNTVVFLYDPVLNNQQPSEDK